MTPRQPSRDVQIDEIFAITRLAITRREIEVQLNREGIPESSPASWLVISDAVGVTCSRVDPPEDAETQVLHAVFHRDEHVRGAALVNCVRPHGTPELLCAAIARAPENSDLRRAPLIGDGALIGKLL